MSEVICNKMHLTKTRVHNLAASCGRRRAGSPPSGWTPDLPSARWDRVLRQAEVIRCLSECADDAGGRGSGCRVAAIDEAAAELGVSRRQMYVLLQRFRAGSGRVTDLMPASPDGGRGRGRLDYRVEAIVAETIRKRFLSRQKRSVAVIHREIRQACVAQGLQAPSRNTVASRIDRLHPAQVARGRGGPDAARPLQSAGDDVPRVDGILERVQIDHTVIDVIVVDERERQPVGRPYLSIGLDEASRCAVGMVVTLEPPSATSVGLCLAHMACDKSPGCRIWVSTACRGRWSERRESCS